MSEDWEGEHRGVEYEISAGDHGLWFIFHHPEIPDYDYSAWRYPAGWNALHHEARRVIDEELGGEE